MKESYPDDIMLCFVQGFGNGDRKYMSREDNDCDEFDNGSDRKVYEDQEVLPEDRPKRLQNAILRKSLRLPSGQGFMKSLPEARRSLSDRFSVVADGGLKRPVRGFLAIRKTWSTGNFAAGAAGGGCGAPRSAPATPLQLEPHPRVTKHDKDAVKSLSGSAPSVRVHAESTGGAAGDSDGKQPYKSRQKKFQRHFPQVGPEERVLNYYACALVGDLLLQGHLYITKNYFAFYSNVFGYVTKLLIPTTTVIRITKEKVARIIPNAVGVCTRDERHVFGSLLSRDTTYKLMLHVWKAAKVPEMVPKPQELRASEVELDASEYSQEDDSSSAGGDHVDVEPPCRRESEAIITATGGAAVIQPALLAGAGVAQPRRSRYCRPLLVCAALVLTLTAAWLAYALYRLRMSPQEEVLKMSSQELYSELVRWRARLHGRAASELHAFLTTNLMMLTKVRQSLEALSGVILTDMAQAEYVPVDLPNETVFS